MRAFAEHAVPMQWWIPHHTLARAQLNGGNLQGALRSFSSALVGSPPIAAWGRPAYTNFIPDCV